MLTFFAGDSFQRGLAFKSTFTVSWQKDHANTVLPRRRKVHADPDALIVEELVRKLKKDPRAVTRVLLRTTGTAVLQIQKDLDSLLYNTVGFAAL